MIWLSWLVLRFGAWNIMTVGSDRARCWVLRARPYGWSSDADPSELRTDCVGVMGGWSLLENCTVDASICGQVFKGARWMPWH
jgi:hypothetical protein